MISIYLLPDCDARRDLMQRMFVEGIADDDDY